MQYEVPDDRYYTKSHEWVRLEGDRAVVGLTSYAVEELGDITYLEVKPIGTEVKQGDPLGLVESSKTTEKIYTPVSGEIIEINKEAGVIPEGSDEIPMGLETITEDPYNQGWIVTLKVRGNIEEEIKNLLTSEQYRKLLEESH
ncbi:MAG: glycine cleavage system protein GcvH [Candidatus Korarchaeota archaeon]|nr:glycine cleavage system protein GcvH [Candidatus Korarchaeota archaeon]